jgi:hypothetical protein
MREPSGEMATSWPWTNSGASSAGTIVNRVTRVGSVVRIVPTIQLLIAVTMAPTISAVAAMSADRQRALRTDVDDSVATASS